MLHRLSPDYGPVLELPVSVETPRERTAREAASLPLADIRQTDIPPKRASLAWFYPPDLAKYRMSAPSRESFESVSSY